MFIRGGLRSNAVVVNDSDCYRDTMMAAVRGDGVDFPLFFIQSQYGNASRASGRRPPPNTKPIKGMTEAEMYKWIDMMSNYVQEPSLLLLDRLSVHKSKRVIEYIESWKLSDGRQMFKVKLLKPKTSFLISPLDMGLFGAFKKYLYQLDRSSYGLKVRAARAAWRAVSNQAVINSFRHCGIVCSDSLDTLRGRYMKQVRSDIPEEFKEVWDFYDGWRSGAFDIEGCISPHSDPLASPSQLDESALDGFYWNHYK
jgi:hypothetical protein